MSLRCHYSKGICHSRNKNVLNKKKVVIISLRQMLLSSLIGTVPSMEHFLHIISSPSYLTAEGSHRLILGLVWGFSLHLANKRQMSVTDKK